VHIQKTGGTSIKKALLPFANPKQLYFDGEKVTDGPGFRPHQPMTYPLAREYSNYFKFAIVRNPWERHASIWKFLKGRRSTDIGDIDFDTYIYKVYNNELGIYSKSQLSYVCDNGFWMVDYIGRFESLDLSFDYICDKICIDRPPLPHYKNQGNYDWRLMYNPETHEMIKEHCKADIEEFNYSFE